MFWCIVIFNSLIKWKEKLELPLEKGETARTFHRFPCLLWESNDYKDTVKFDL